MNRGPRRGAALRTSLTPIVLMACLAALVAVVALLRGSASGAKPEERGSKAAGPPSATPSPASADAGAARTQVHALARLEPEAGIVTVGVRPGMRIERIAVRAGDEVAAGAELALLEGHAQARLQLALAEAQKALADAQKTYADDQRALSRERLAIEREREDRLKKDRLETQQHLVEIAKRRLQASADIYKTLGQAAQGKVKFDLDLAYFQAEADALKVQLELKELEVGLDLLARRRALEDRQVDLRVPETDVPERQVDLARAGLDQTRVVSPVAGRILEVSAHVGEVSAGPLLSMGDLSSMVAVAEVYQSDVPEVKVGDPAEALILGRSVAGRVSRISRLVGRNTLASLDPRALQDRRVVAVTIRLDDAAPAAEYVNMEVEVTIRPQSQSQHQHGGSR